MDLVLGTVQFGLPYGIAGRGAVVPESEVRTILETAWAGGIHMLDTAPGYGNIEARLADVATGLDFEVISKVPPLPDGASTDDAVAHVTRSCEQSRERLGDRLTVVLLHRAEDLLGSCGDAVWRAAVAAMGSAGRVGVSCYGPDTLLTLRQRYPITVAQLPGNALDQRLATPEAAAGVQDIEIHLRSAFLQGLLLLPADEGARRLPVATTALRAWADWCRTRARVPLEAALGIARALPGVRHCVVGVDDRSQLDDILQAWRVAEPQAAPELACADEDVIDPRRWARP